MLVKYFSQQESIAVGCVLPAFAREEGIGSQWGKVSVQIWHIVSKIRECITGEPEGLSLIRFAH